MTKIGTKIDKLYSIREQLRELDAEAKKVRAKKEELEMDILQQMNNEKVTQARGNKATLSVSEQVVPQVTDWDISLPWIKKQNKLYLFERRISAKAFREELESRKGKPIPGMQSYTKPVINLRSLS